MHHMYTVTNVTEKSMDSQSFCGTASDKSQSTTVGCQTTSKHVHSLVLRSTSRMLRNVTVLAEIGLKNANTLSTSISN